MKDEPARLFDAVLAELEKTRSLLEEREFGLWMWQDAVQQRLHALSEFLQNNGWGRDYD